MLAAAVRRAVRQGAGFVGTEHCAGADSGVLAESDPDVMALMRAAHHHARVETVLPVSRALHECLRAAIAEAGDGVLTTNHLSQAFSLPKTVKPEEAPAVWLLRRTGALEGDAGGGWVRWLMRRIVRRQGLGGPVLTVVRNEAGRLAVAAGRPEATAADLVAAVLTVDHQLTVAGRRLRPEFESGGAAALRAAGVDPAALPAASGAGVERFIEGAKLVAARRGDDVVGTTHLLAALCDDLLDPAGAALRGFGVETLVAPVGTGGAACGYSSRVVAELRRESPGLEPGAEGASPSPGTSQAPRTA